MTDKPGPKPLLDALPHSVKSDIVGAIERGDKWTDIVDYLADLEVATSESALRRWAKTNGIVKPHSRAATIDPAKVLARREAAAAGDETAKLEARVSALQADLAVSRKLNEKLSLASDRDVAITAAVLDTVEQHFAGVSAPVRPYTPRASHKDYTPQEFLAHISDAHYGEVVNPELASGAAYDPIVCLRRMRYIRDKIIRFADLRPYQVKTLHAAYLGDMLSGANHEDLDVTNASVMADQTLEMGDAIFEQVSAFAEEFEEVRVVIITGNHPREHKIPRHKQRHANYEYLMGQVVARLVKLSGLENVTVEAPRSSKHVINVAGRRVCLTHGDGVKAASFAGIPWYAMKSKRDALQSMYRALGIEPVDQISMGHFHQHIHWPADCNIVVNGSIKGGDEFVQDTRYAHTPALQIVQDWHPRKGLSSTNYIDPERADS